MANVIYNSGRKDILAGNIDLLTDTIKVMLVTSSYTPNIDTDTKRSDVTNEVTGTGYTAGGVALASKAVTQNNTTNRGEFDCADIVINDAEITARGAVIYKSRGGLSSADELVGYLDFGSDITSMGGDFKITINVLGLLNI